MARKKVLLVTHYFSAHRSGIEILAEQLARRLATRHSFEIAWASSNINDTKYLEDIPIRPVPMAGTNIIEQVLHVPYPIWWPWAWPVLWREVGKSDIVHLHDCLYMGNVLAMLFARMRKKPTLLTQHIATVPYKNPVLRLMMIGANKTLGWFVLTGATRVVFYSDAVMREMSANFRLRQPPLFISNGVDSELFQPAGDTVRTALQQKFGLLAGQPIFLFVGRFVEKKGLAVLHRLAQIFPNAVWLFAGWGPLDPSAWNLPNVHVFKDRSGASLVELYQSADLFVLPSVGEGFPVVVQESFACGTPALIGLDTVAAQPLAKDLLLGEPVYERDLERTVEGWRRRIESLLSNRSTLENLRPAIRDLACRHWSWSDSARQYAELISDLISTG